MLHGRRVAHKKSRRRIPHLDDGTANRSKNVKLDGFDLFSSLLLTAIFKLGCHALLSKFTWTLHAGVKFTSVVRCYGWMFPPLLCRFSKTRARGVGIVGRSFHDLWLLVETHLTGEFAWSKCWNSGKSSTKLPPLLEARILVILIHGATFQTRGPQERWLQPGHALFGWHHLNSWSSVAVFSLRWHFSIKHVENTHCFVHGANSELPDISLIYILMILNDF